MWDVTLGQPCVRHIVTHTRCANAVSLCCNILLGGSFNLTSFDALFFSWNTFQVAVAPNDEYISTGGSDQKVVSCLFGLLVSYVAYEEYLLDFFCHFTTIEINRKAIQSYSWYGLLNRNNYKSKITLGSIYMN